MMLDPRTILIAIPAYDGKVMAETTGGLTNSIGLYAAVSIPTECSHVSLVRNLIAGQFLASPFEWLVCVDSDIAFSREDLRLLLEPCDTRAIYHENIEEGIETGSYSLEYPKAVPRPTRVVTAQCQPLDNKTGAAADVLVCAEYSFKNDLLEPVKFGMGFVRIHRSVFERLQELKHDGGPTVEVDRNLLEQLQNLIMPDSSDEVKNFSNDELLSLANRLVLTKQDTAGQPRLWQVSHKGRLYTDFFPSGPLISQFVPTAEWKGEDHGFFTLCMLAGIIPRIETRTRVIHLGRKGYPYLGPDLGGGQ